MSKKWTRKKWRELEKLGPPFSSWIPVRLYCRHHLLRVRFEHSKQLVSLISSTSQETSLVFCFVTLWPYIGIYSSMLSAYQLKLTRSILVDSVPNVSATVTHQPTLPANPYSLNIWRKRKCQHCINDLLFFSLSSLEVFSMTVLCMGCLDRRGSIVACFWWNSPTGSLFSLLLSPSSTSTQTHLLLCIAVWLKKLPSPCMILPSRYWVFFFFFFISV